MGNTAAFLAVLQEKKKVVWPEIKKYLSTVSDFPDFCRLPSGYQKLAKLHQNIVSEYPQRMGKYVRPTLVLLTAEAMGFPQQKAIKTAAAMQISEEWILGHDDIEDDSLERRGKPVLHRLFGRELAINAGDALHLLMWKVLHDNEGVVGIKKAGQIEEEFYLMLSRTVLGQTIELEWARENRVNLTEKDVLLIMESKTGYYTMAGPMRLGALLAGASPSQLAVLYKFGKLLGYCFQIRDDLLDLVSDFAGLKKQRGNDVYEGKRTLMLVYLLGKLKGIEKKKLIEILRKKREEKKVEEIDWVIKMMAKTGALIYAQRLINQYLAQAASLFDVQLSFLSRQPARSNLRSFIDFLATRGY